VSGLVEGPRYEQHAPFVFTRILIVLSPIVVLGGGGAIKDSFAKTPTGIPGSFSLCCLFAAIVLAYELPLRAKGVRRERHVRLLGSEEGVAWTCTLLDPQVRGSLHSAVSAWSSSRTGSGRETLDSSPPSGSGPWSRGRPPPRGGGSGRAREKCNFSSRTERSCASAPAARRNSRWRSAPSSLPCREGAR